MTLLLKVLAVLIVLLLCALVVIAWTLVHMIARALDDIERDHARARSSSTQSPKQ